MLAATCSRTSPWLSKRERELLEELAAEMGEDVNEEKRSPLQKLRDIFE